jgi:hypothetical protein
LKGNRLPLFEDRLGASWGQRGLPGMLALLLKTKKSFAIKQRTFLNVWNTAV